MARQRRAAASIGFRLHRRARAAADPGAAGGDHLRRQRAGVLPLRAQPSLIWSEEVSAWCMVWVVFLGAVSLMRRDGLVSIPIFVTLLPPTPRAGGRHRQPGRGARRVRVPRLVRRLGCRRQFQHGVAGDRLEHPLGSSSACRWARRDGAVRRRLSGGGYQRGCGEAAAKPLPSRGPGGQTSRLRKRAPRSSARHVPTRPLSRIALLRLAHAERAGRSQPDPLLGLLPRILRHAGSPR